MLTPPDMPRWLGDQPLPDEVLRVLYQPIAGERMMAREMNRYANKPHSEGPGCISPPDEPEAGLGLGM